MGDNNRDLFVCECFFTNNIFLAEFDCHVEFPEGRERFLRDYGQELKKKGCTDEQLEETIKKIEAEMARRRSLGEKVVERKEFIRANYSPKHPEAYKIQEEFFRPEFLEIVKYAKSNGATLEGLMKLIKKEAADRSYSFPLFTAEFARTLYEELMHFERSSMPRAQPNSMNKYGIMLNELGFDEEFLTPLRERYINPVTALLFPDWGGGQLDSHKVFTVHYQADREPSLAYHYDNSEVTYNVPLGTDYEGGGLFFGPMRTDPPAEQRTNVVFTEAGAAFIHRGQQRHAALPITSGKRVNLIVWNRCSKIRNKLCPMCDRPPRPVKQVGYGDGFTL